MLITVECDYPESKNISSTRIELTCDAEGVDFLINILKSLKERGEFDHEHLFTPAWGGNELSEEKQGEENVLLNHLKIYYVPN